MVDLQIAFGSQSEILEDGKYIKSHINHVMATVTDNKWYLGGYRFQRRNTESRHFKCSFYCAQDKAILCRTISKNLRDNS